MLYAFAFATDERAEQNPAPAKVDREHAEKCDHAKHAEHADHAKHAEHAEECNHAKHAEHAKAVTADCCAKDGGCEHRNAETAMLATKAEGGCSKSAAKLVKMAKKSGCPKGEALAARALKGDEKAEAELIAMFATDDAEK